MNKNYCTTNVQNNSINPSIKGSNLLNEILFNTPKIDSFTLLIPYNRANKDKIIVSSTFDESYEKVYSTGECEDHVSFYNRYQKIEDKSTCTFVKYNIVNRLWNGINKDFIQVMLTSKLLLTDYFTGINKDNIHFVVNRINEDKVIKVNIDTILNSYVTDIDICKDYKLNQNQFIELKDQLMALVLDEKAKFLNTKRINSKDMFGIQYNERHKATPAAPFAKLYYKTLELTQKSIDFYNANLKDYEDIVLKGIGRFEVTIKASQHKKKLGIENVKTLNNLLNLDINELNRIYTSIVNQYYKASNVIKQINTEKMSTSNLVILNFIEYIFKVNRELSSVEITNIITANSFDKKQKHSIKAKVLELIKVSKNSKEIALNDEKKKVVLNVLKDLNILED